MNSNRYLFNLFWYTAHAIVLLTLFGLLSVTAFAKENHYRFNQIAQLNHLQSVPSQWLKLVTNPRNTQQYFIINKSGQMYLVDDMKELHPLLDLNANDSKGSSSIKLTAIELHPNFALRNQPGHGTFYTAHLEILDEKSRTKRIQESSDELILKFDAVITEWQFSSINYQKVDLDTKREILRIAVPDNSMTIKQMSFSPYTKSWNDDFGLLYIALNGQKKWQKPLYSGVLLRINPDKFSLLSFTVPSSNPYLKESEIKNEIYLLGGQNINQFIWPTKNSDDILLSHRYNDKSLLSLTGVQNDWRDNAPKKIIYQNDKFIEDVMLYRGSYLLNLRNKMLLLTKDKRTWFLESLDIKPSVNKSMLVENTPQQEWQFTTKQLANNSEILFSHNGTDEVLILDKTAGMVFQLFQENSPIKTLTEKNVTAAETQGEPRNRVYIFFLIMIVVVIVFYFFKRNKSSAKAIVRKQFAHIELSESQQQIGFYHRHNKSVDTVVDIIDIVICEVKLNDNSIAVINQNVGHGFDHAKEQDLRAIFAKEKVDKMVEGKTRQISLSFSDTHNKNFSVCLYMRKGSNRITKRTYAAVIDDLIDWCWLLATKINSDETEKRKKKPAISSELVIDSVEQKRNQNLLHNQASVNRPDAYEAVKIEQSSEKELIPEKAVTMGPDGSLEVVEQCDQNSTIDTELVYALEKLVNLKQQGFLTQEEFTKAKENLLRSLFDK